MNSKNASKFHDYYVSFSIFTCRIAWNTACEVANGALSGVVEGDLRVISAAINQVRAQVKLAYATLQNAEKMAAHFQIRLGLESRWQVGGEEYLRYKNKATLGKYYDALRELERLVVMRLFELSKLSMSGTGIQWRSYFVIIVLIANRIQAPSTNKQGFSTEVGSDPECNQSVQRPSSSTGSTSSIGIMERYHEVYIFGGV